MEIGKPKIFTGAVCQNLTQLKFSLQFLRENSSITFSKLMVRSRLAYSDANPFKRASVVVNRK